MNELQKKQSSYLLFTQLHLMLTVYYNNQYCFLNFILYLIFPSFSINIFFPPSGFSIGSCCIQWSYLFSFLQHLTVPQPSLDFHELEFQSSAQVFCRMFLSQFFIIRSGYKFLGSILQSFLCAVNKGSIMLIGFITGYVHLHHLVKLVSSGFLCCAVTNFSFLISKYLKTIF